MNKNANTDRVEDPGQVDLYVKNRISLQMDKPWGNEEGAFLQEVTCLFLAAQPQNNYTETVLIKSLLGLLDLDSYWLDLIS